MIDKTDEPESPPKEEPMWINRRRTNKPLRNSEPSKKIISLVKCTVYTRIKRPEDALSYASSCWAPWTSETGETKLETIQNSTTEMWWKKTTDREKGKWHRTLARGCRKRGSWALGGRPLCIYLTSSSGSRSKRSTPKLIKGLRDLCLLLVSI